MSIAKQVQTIRRGLFTDGYNPLDMLQILDNGTQSVVHWGRVRPAVVALREMPWHRLDSQWEYFLDESRYPVGHTIDLRPDEVGTFQNLLHNLGGVVKIVCSRSSLPGLGRRPDMRPFSWHSG